MWISERFLSGLILSLRDWTFSASIPLLSQVVSQVFASGRTFLFYAQKLSLGLHVFFGAQWNFTTLESLFDICLCPKKKVALISWPAQRVFFQASPETFLYDASAPLRSIKPKSRQEGSSRSFSLLLRLSSSMAQLLMCTETSINSLWASSGVVYALYFMYEFRTVFEKNGINQRSWREIRANSSRRLWTCLIALAIYYHASESTNKSSLTTKISCRRFP